MRNFICKIRVIRLRDVRTEMCESVKEELQKRFMAYGVLIEQVNIMSTMLPIDLRHILKQTTQYDVVLQEQVKRQQHNMIRLKNNQSKATLKLRRDNMEVISKLNHDKDVEEIQQFSDIIGSETYLEVAKVNAETFRNTQLTLANNTKLLSENKAKARSTLLLSNANAYEMKKKADADNQAEIIRVRAATRLQCAKDKTEALLKECSALQETQEFLVEKQLHEQRMKYLDVIKPLAGHGKIAITQQTNEDAKDVEIFKLLGDDHSAEFEKQFGNPEDDE